MEYSDTVYKWQISVLALKGIGVHSPFEHLPEALPCRNSNRTFQPLED